MLAHKVRKFLECESSLFVSARINHKPYCNTLLGFVAASDHHKQKLEVSHLVQPTEVGAAKRVRKRAWLLQLLDLTRSRQDSFERSSSSIALMLLESDDCEF